MWSKKLKDVAFQCYMFQVDLKKLIFIFRKYFESMKILHTCPFIFILKQQQQQTRVAFGLSGKVTCICSFLKNIYAYSFLSKK